MNIAYESVPIDIEAITEQQLAYVEDALKDIAEEIKQRAKDNLKGNIRTGSLIEAIATKVKRTKENKNRIYAIVGIDNDYVTSDEKGNKIRPSKYAHFIELGTSTTAGTFFLSKAANSYNQQIIDRLTEAASKAL